MLHLENASLSGRPLMLLGKSVPVRPAAGQVTQHMSWPVTPTHPLPATALKMNMNLQELYLADNKLNGLQDSAQLGNLLKFNCSLQILDLRNNHVLDSGAWPPAPVHAVTQPLVCPALCQGRDAKYKRELSQYCPPGLQTAECAGSESSDRSLHRRE